MSDDDPQEHREGPSPHPPLPPYAHSYPGVKRCPMCAETVHAEALVCRFCSYDWRTGTLAQSAPALNGLAVASLGLGIASLLLVLLIPVSVLSAAAALGCGIAGGRQIERARGSQSGGELARAGVVFAAVALVIAIILAIVVLAAGTISVDIQT